MLPPPVFGSASAHCCDPLLLAAIHETGSAFPQSDFVTPALRFAAGRVFEVICSFLTSSSVNSLECCSIKRVSFKEIMSSYSCPAAPPDPRKIFTLFWIRSRRRTMHGEHSSRSDSIGYRVIRFDHKFRLGSVSVLASDHAFRRLASHRKLVPGKHLALFAVFRHMSWRIATSLASQHEIDLRNP